jgi:hypothetical protein
MEFLDKSIVNNQYPTLKQYQTACKKADIADFNGRDSRGLISIINRIKNISPRLKGLINTRKTGVFAYDYYFDSENKQDLKPLKIKLSKVMRAALLAPIEKELFGDYLAEVKVRNGVEGFTLEKIAQTKYEPINEYEFWLYDENNNSRQIINTSNNPRKFIYLTGETLNRGGILRTVMDLEIRRFDNIREWSLFNERVKGQILGMINAEKMETASRSSFGTFDVAKDLEVLNNAVANVGNNQYAVLSDAYEIKLQSMTEPGASPTFSGFNKDLDAAISIAILGQANTSELPNSGGSRAALQVLSKMTADIFYNDMLEAKNIADQILTIDWNLNNSRVGTPNYEFAWKYDEKEDTEAYSRIFANIAQTRPETLIDANEYYSKQGLDRPDGVEDIISVGSQNNTSLI